jgi:uncharacterized protein YjiS (DUF1127 family)
MTTNIHNSFTLGKVGAMLFARQTPMVAAERHQGMLESLKSWRARRAAQAELNNLSDRELADIGVTRQQIPEVIVRGQR